MFRSEGKVKSGMKNAASLEEGKTLMEEVKHWKLESEAIKTVLDNGNASAQKMTSHGEVIWVHVALSYPYFARLTRYMHPT